VKWPPCRRLSASLVLSAATHAAPGMVRSSWAWFVAMVTSAAMAGSVEVSAASTAMMKVKMGGRGVQERWESWIPSPESSSFRSSTSQHRLAAFLVRLAGGGEAVGDLIGESGGGGDCDGSSGGTCSGSGGRAVSAGGVDGAGDGAEIKDWSSLVAAATMAVSGGASEASVAAAFR
jgi:hypothetical protein